MRTVDVSAFTITPVSYTHLDVYKRQDVRWVVRKYLFYLESRGFSSLADVSVDAVKDFILQTASDVKAASLHLMSWLGYKWRLLKS